MKVFSSVLTALALVLPAAAQVEHRETIRRTIPLPSGPLRLVVDNVEGGIKVSTGAEDAAEIVVEQQFRAPDRETLDQARRDVRLDVTQNGGTLKLYVDGPFRCDNGGLRWDHERGYRARFDFEIRMPRRASIELKTVNGGEISASGFDGSFRLNNVNGGITLMGAATGGQIHTVNGRIKVDFRANPAQEVSLRTVNGSIESTFRPGFSGDLALKTLNGQILTDFDTSELPVLPAQPEKTANGFRFRSDRLARVRIGSGGVQHKFETLNGEIRILKGK